MHTIESCTCAECVSCCTRTPGWFAPGEAEKAAALVGMPFDEFRSAFLVLDYWEGGDDGRIFVLAPGKVEIEEKARGAQRPVTWGYAFRRGRCVFLSEDDRCRIHEAKPMECRGALACGSGDRSCGRSEIAKMWERVGRP